jgi:hypothetical protein
MIIKATSWSHMKCWSTQTARSGHWTYTPPFYTVGSFWLSRHWATNKARSFGYCRIFLSLDQSRHWNSSI